jgi:vacuolar iron transporter family protein
MDIIEHLESHHASSKAKYIKNIIFGGIDGIITTFSIIAACFGSGLQIKYIIAMGFANLVADAFSMGFGDYISSLFESKYILSEAKKETREYETNINYEINEMIELYQREGLEEEDSKKIVNLLTENDKYKDFFIKSMVKMELGLEIPEDNYKKEIKKEALITFLSFMFFGFIPLSVYLFSYWGKYDKYNDIFMIDCFVTFLTIVSLGYVQAVITKQPRLLGCISLTINGFISTSLAFLLGYGLEKAID